MRFRFSFLAHFFSQGMQTRENFKKKHPWMLKNSLHFFLLLTQLFENFLKDPPRFQVQYQLDQWFGVTVIHVLRCEL